MWGNDQTADIKIDEVFEGLQPDTFMRVLCEGCGLVGIGKTSDNEMTLAMINEEQVIWMPKDAFMELPQKF